MPGRSYAFSSYRYGFNGKENDNEVKGTGNQQDYGLRIYDSRIGRFLSVDPLGAEFPWNSSYAFAENDVVRSIDLEGAEKHVRTFAYAISDGKTVSKVISNDYKQPEGTFNPYHSLVGGPMTTEEIVADGFIRANKLPDDGTFSFFVFIPELGKANYSRYEYVDPGGKQQVRYFDANYVAGMYEHFEKEQQQANKILSVTGAVLNAVGAGALIKAELKGLAAEAKSSIVNLPATSPKFDPQKQALAKGNLKIPASKNGYAPDFSGTSHLYPVNGNQKNIVQIKLTGSYSGDFSVANAAAGLSGTKAPKGYTWHHLDDFNPSTGTATMQLVKSNAHTATVPHTGGVKQYEVSNNTTYRQ